LQTASVELPRELLPGPCLPPCWSSSKTGQITSYIFRTDHELATGLRVPACPRCQTDADCATGRKLADAAAPAEGNFVRMFEIFRRAALAGALLLSPGVLPSSTGRCGSC